MVVFLLVSLKQTTKTGGGVHEANHTHIIIYIYESCFDRKVDQDQPRSDSKGDVVFLVKWCLFTLD